MKQKIKEELINLINLILWIANIIIWGLVLSYIF